ncbi:hypothetical protein YB2330_004994 [Saitoella coloradoensis]
MLVFPSSPMLWFVGIWPHVLSPLRSMPGPDSNLLFGFGPFAEAWLCDGNRQLEWHRKYGSFVKFRTIMGLERVSVTDPKAIATILNNPDTFPKPSYFQETLIRIIGNSVIALEGDEHKRQRRVLLPVFALRNLKHVVPNFAKSCEALVEYWDKELDARGDGVAVNVTEPINRTMLDMIGSAGFGFEFNTLHNSDHPLAKSYHTLIFATGINKLLDGMSAISWPLQYWPFGRFAAVTKAKRVIVDESMKLIDKRRGEMSVNEKDSHHEGESRDLLSCMLRKQMQAKPGEEVIEDDDMVQMIMTFLAAGHETLATTVLWTLHALSIHSDIQSRLRTELSRLDDEITYDSLESCRYLNNFVREVIRFWPPASVTMRVARENSRLGDYVVPKDTIIQIAPAVVNKLEEFWGCDAETFDPDRWDALPEGVGAYNMLTFLEGPRKCIGWKFAMLELKAFLAVFLRRFEVESMGRDVGNETCITTKPAGGLTVGMRRVKEGEMGGDGDSGVEA